MTKTESVILKPVPELTEVDPGDRLQEFYRKLRWEKEQVLDPTLVKMDGSELTEIIAGEMAHAREVIANTGDLAVAVGLLWMNKGPSGGGGTPGFVELHPGWVREL